MTDEQLLRQRIDIKGYTIVAISKVLGISREGLYKKLSGETEFKASEIVKISELLQLNNSERDKIFLQ